MAWVIGPVTLQSYEEPNDGTIQFGRRGLWAYMNPIGFTGRIRQFLGYDGNDAEPELTCGEVTLQALNALVGPTPVLVSLPRPGWAGKMVTIDSVDAVWTREVPGCWTQEDIDDALDAHPTGDGFGLYIVRIKMVELQPV